MEKLNGWNLNKLHINDFAPYVDLSSLQESGSLNTLLEFSYND